MRSHDRVSGRAKLEPRNHLILTVGRSLLAMRKRQCAVARGPGHSLLRVETWILDAEMVSPGPLKDSAWPLLQASLSFIVEIAFC